MKNLKILSFILGLFIIFSCQKEDVLIVEEESGIYINNDLNYLGKRVKSSGENVPIIDSELKSTSNYQLTLIATVDSPEFEGTTLQASHIKMVNDYAYVTYNIQGSVYLGGAEIFNVSNIQNPQLISQAIFSDMDISSIDAEPLGSGNNNFVYVVGAYDPNKNYLNNGPSVVERLIVNSANQFKHLTSPRQFYDLPGYMGNDVRYNSQAIYVTSGSNGGLTVLNNGMNLNQYEDIPYTRSVDVRVSGPSNKLERVVVYSAQEGLIVFDGNNNELRRIATGGNHFPNGIYTEAKSIVRLHGDLAFVSVGDGGVEVYNIETGELTHTIELPGASLEDGFVSNGVAITNDLVLIANGETGVAIYSLNDYSFIGSFTLSGSVNYVGAINNKIFVATGLGGLSILEITEN